MFIAGLTGSPDEIGWESLSSLTKMPLPLFEKTLFLQGYEFSSNVYVIQGDYLSIIDPGNDYTAFMELFSLGVKPTDIKKAVLTHGHQDHIMGVVELFRGYGGAEGRDLEVILHEAGPRQFKEMVRGLGCRLTEVKDGETLDLSGFAMEVIHTPGHTLDGISIYHEPSRTLFSGDTVLPHAMAEIDQSSGGRMDHYLYALRTLLKKDIDHVMPGHGGIVVNIGQLVVRDTFEGLIRKLVNIDTPWLEAAMTLAQKGLLEEALFCTNKELAENPENLQALEVKAFCLHDLGRQQEAVEIFDQILAQKADHLYVLMGKGCALMGLARYEDSLKYFEAALKIKPDLKEALINKGLALYLSGQPEAALDIEAFRTQFADKMKEFFQKPTAPD
jgi:hydroxyacylglutathione hydrolase